MMKNNTFDCIVIGLGAMGSAALYQLARSGARVLGIDAYAPPHDRGSTHGGSRIIRLAYQEGREYIPLLHRAYASWREIEAASGQSLLQITGGLMIGSREGSIVARSQQSADQESVAYEILDAAEIMQRFPAFQAGEDQIALYDPAAGVLHPEKAVAAQLGLARQQRAQVRLNEKVLRWEAIGEGARVVTAAGEYQAGRLILCTGPWAGPLLAQMGMNLAVERIVQFWMAPKEDFSAFAPDRFPIFIWTADPHLEFYGIPGMDGPQGGVKISYYPKGPHALRQLCTPDTLDRDGRPADLAQMRPYLRALLPGLDGRCIRTAVCMHSNTPDMHPVICTHPSHPQVVLAAGFSGHGFKFSNVIGEILAELATEGKSRFDLDLFHPQALARILQQHPSGDSE